MSKRIRRLSSVAAPYGAQQDAKIMFKYENLLQDYQELDKEVNETRSRLEYVKHKKLILLAEVRFLRQRHKYLLANRPPYPKPEREVVPLPKSKSETKHRNNTKAQTLGRGVPAFQDLNSSLDQNKKGRVYNRKESARRKVGPSFDLNHTEASQSAGRSIGSQNTTQFSNPSNLEGKEVVRNHSMSPVIDLNQSVRRYGGTAATPHIADPPLDLNQNEMAYAENVAPSHNRPPIFDLNEISGEEEDFQNNCDPISLDEPIKGLIRGGTDEKLSGDLKLPICRNVGDGSARIGKRKISWQDPVALRV